MKSSDVRANVWINHLTLPFLFWALLRQGRCRTLFCYGTTSSWACRALAWLAKLGLLVRTERRQIEFGAADPKGDCILQQVDIDLLRFAEQLFPDGELTYRWLPLVCREEGIAWVKLLRTYFVSYSRTAIGFGIGVANVYACGEIVVPERAVCYIAPEAFARYCADCLNGREGTPVRYRPWPTPGLFRQLFHFLPGSPVSWFRMLWDALCRRGRVPLQRIHQAALSQGVILQQGVPGTFERMPDSGYLHWYEGSGIPPERVVIYLNRPDMPCRNDVIEQIERHGFGWVDAAKIQEHLPRPFRAAFRALTESVRACAKPARASRFWRMKILLFHLVLTDAYQMFLAHTNGRVVMQSWDFIPTSVALSIAARREQVLYTWYLRSIHQYLGAKDHGGIADLLLAWGPLHHGFFTVQEYDYRLMLQVGMVCADGAGDHRTERGRHVRDQLPARVRFVIAALDTSFGPTCHNAQWHLETFFGVLVRLVDDHDDWGLVVKRKHEFPPVPLDVEDIPRFEKLRKSGRCILLDPSETVSIAAHASDLAVCSSINTAGFLAALCGKPALHLDLSGMTQHPVMSDGGEGKIVFRTAESLVRAIEAVADGDAEIGNHEHWMPLIDSFQDGKGRYRAGAVFKAYLEARDRGLDRDGALRAVAEQYAAKYGAQHVSWSDAPQETGGDRLWALARDRYADDGSRRGRAT